MKKVSILFIAALFMAASLGLARPAPAQDVTWQLVNPMGGFEVTQIHAPRLDTLEGKTICELSNDSWQTHRVLPTISTALKDRYPTATFVAAQDLPMGMPAMIDAENTAQILKDRGCEAVIVGNAG